MAGCWQEAAWMRKWREAGQPETWREKFIPAGPYSNKVRCRECGSMGYPGVWEPHPWQIGCLIGHKYTCPDCGAKSHNLYSHQNCKIYSHGKCCRHHNTQFRELQRLLEEEAA